MTRSMYEFHGEFADVENVTALDSYQIRITQARNSFDSLSLAFVDVDLGFDLADHLGRPLDILPHHVPPEVVLVVMSYQDFFEVVLFAFRIVDDSLNVPCRVDHRGFARDWVSNDIDEISHRPQLSL